MISPLRPRWRAALLAPTAHVHLLDEHLRAVDTARDNLRLNGVRNAEVFLSDLFSAVGGALWLVVVSNVRPVFDCLLTRGGCPGEVVARGRQHVVLVARAP